MSSFLDTNVLVYAVESGDSQRAVRARDLVAACLRRGDGVVSTQVLQEFFNIATRKMGLDAASARRYVELFATLETVQISTELIFGAIDLHQLRSISFWDALVIRAAREAGCERIWTEDLQDGVILDGVRVENPFR